MEHLITHPEAISESIEMYLLRIALLQQAGQPVPLPVLAQELAVSPVSANEMSRKLVEKHLVAYEPYKGVTLTPQGQELARHVLRCRRLWEVFFVEQLSIEPAEAEALACRFEHVTPEALAERLADFLNYPLVSPQNQPIPYEHLPPEAPLAQPLTTLAVGASAQVARLTGEAVFQEFLRQQGLRPGQTIKILAAAANGTRLLELSGQLLSLTGELAAMVAVNPHPNPRLHAATGEGLGEGVFNKEAADAFTR